jgi:pimeloyl-ACP methyl ester carboxylesterase
VGQTYLEPPLRTARVDGAERAWREAGEGPGAPLFLLHGIGSNARAWAGQFAAFSNGRRVVAWNAPGYAGSTPLACEAPSPDDYACAALALMDHLGLGRAVVVGQSLGAIMATAVALRAPQRVAALGLTSPASGYGVPQGEALPEKIARRIADLSALGPVGLAERRAGALLTDAASGEARALVYKAMSEVVPEGYAQAVRMLAAADLPRDVQGLTVPVRVVWGGADQVTPPQGCRRVAEAAPGASWVEIPGLGHGAATEAPDLFNAAIEPLLAAADAGR